jgi:imidazolonepropionase
MATETRVWTNARVATFAPALEGPGAIESAALVVRDGKLDYVGASRDLPHGLLSRSEVVDCEGRWITPGLIDCHTHLVHGGNRAHEFEMRIGGATYEEITRAGGGIVSSVRDTRAASESELSQSALPRLDRLIAEGVTTLEIKSGYGLTIDDEIKMLRTARDLAKLRPVTITTTYLGAHVAPPEYKGRNKDYLQDVVLPGLRAAHEEGLVDAVDAFCEGIAFDPDDVTTLFEVADVLNLPVKLHADQLSNLQGAKLAADFGALSADHLEHADEDGIAAMGAAGTVAVLLPGAFYFIRETRKPRVDLFRDYRVPIALATDCNPGTSPLTSLLLAMNLGATLFGLTVQECLAGVTREAARALGRLSEIGTLEVGKRADFAVWNVEQPAELVYRMGFNPLHQRVWCGQ